MGREFWLMAGAGVVAFCTMIFLIVWLLHLTFKDVTLDGVAESVGKAAAAIERAYERGNAERPHE